MKLTILLLVTFIASCQAFSLRQVVGLCVEECSLHSDCRIGYYCLSNGCGHICRKLPVIVNCLDIMCPDVACVTAERAVDEYGCPICGCRGVEV